jgi:hypothetical protein
MQGAISFSLYQDLSVEENDKPDMQGAIRGKALKKLHINQFAHKIRLNQFN